MKEVTGKFIKEIIVTDPDGGGEVAVEIWKDPESGAMFGVDSSFLDQADAGKPPRIPSPFNERTLILLPEQSAASGVMPSAPPSMRQKGDAR